MLRPLTARPPMYYERSCRLEQSDWPVYYLKHPTCSDIMVCGNLQPQLGTSIYYLAEYTVYRSLPGPMRIGL